MSRPKNSFWTLPNPKNSPLGYQKIKSDLYLSQDQKLELKKA